MIGILQTEFTVGHINMSARPVTRLWKSVYNRIKPLWKKTFFPIGHYYSPVPDREEAKAAIDRAYSEASIPGGIEIDPDAMKALWADLVVHMQHTAIAETATADQRYYFENPYYSYGDGLVLHALLRQMKTERYLEIGSGFSSALALDTRHYHGYPREVTCIEPYPDRLRALLREDDDDQTEILVQKVQNTNLAIYDKLNKNDILFVDSSHVMKTGSDLNFIMHDILPRLNAGVIVHFHDIFWPFEYPEIWAVDQLRGWNEIYAVRNFLMYNGAFQIVFFNDYFAKIYPQMASETCPKFMRNPGGGLWLRKQTDPTPKP